MPFESGVVFGYNSPRTFAIDAKHVYVASSNSIAICEKSSQKVQLWKPSSGLYEVDKIAVNADENIICFTEKRLSVSLYFYHPEDTMHLLCEIPDVASVQVEQLVFANGGCTLFVRCAIPKPVVKVFTLQANKKYTLSSVVELHEENMVCLVPSICTVSRDDFFIVTETGVSGFSFLNGAYASFSLYEGEDIVIRSACCQPSGVVFGTQHGSVFRVRLDAESSNKLEILHPFGDAVTAVAGKADDGQALIVGTEKGSVFSLTRDDVTLLATCERVPLEQMWVSAEGEDVYVSGKGGIYAVKLLPQPEEGKENGGSAIAADATVAAAALVPPIPVMQSLPSPVLRVDPFDDSGFVVCCIDGSFAVVKKGASFDYFYPEEEVKLVCACTYHGGKRLATVCANGVFRGFNTLSGHELWHDVLGDGFHPRVCQADEKGRIVLCDENSIRFVQATPEAYKGYGSVSTELTSDITSVRWLGVDELFLVACQNGELYLLRFPDPCAEDTVHMVENMIQGMWWLDFPFLDMFPCFVDGEGDVINLLVHSADKDTKLYALEKKRDSETKVLRPLFLMRDHNSGGTQIGRLTDTTVYSSGSDGRVVIRDIAHYQAKLSPIPPSKEKRKPEKEFAVRQFGNGGVSSVCLTTGGLLICGCRHDGVLHLLRPDVSAVASWKEPAWVRKRIKTVADTLRIQDGSDENRASNTGGTTMTTKGNLVQQREALCAQMETLKAKWEAAMVDKDPQVPVSALVVDQRKDEFETECDEAIHAMKEEEYYHTLTNEYTQDIIRKKCCDTMDVSRCKLTSLLIDGLEVHNYQILKSAHARKPLVRKVEFLRRLQQKASTGHRFRGFREDETTKEPAAVDVAAAGASSNGVASLFYVPQDLYTHSRLMIQTVLLQSQVLQLKEAFNRKFTDLRELKKGVLSQMDERNQRCVKILRQLDQSVEGLFDPHVDAEEDMTTLFTVTDDELPPDVRGLLQQKSNVTIYSPANEAALKHWMDGLEKDVDVIQVHITPPDFADETKDSFVPPDERTEEQLRLVEEYGKKLKEETEAVNQRREGLRNEFDTLQKEIHTAATRVDEELKVLQQARLSASEQIDEAELYAIGLFRHFLLGTAFHQQYAHLATEASGAQKMVVYTRTLLEAKRTSANAILADIESMEEEYAAYLSSVREEPPFDDGAHGDKMFRRMTRWKNKYDDNKAALPSRESPADDFPRGLWAAFCDHCEELAQMKGEINVLDEKHRAETEAFAVLEDQVRSWEKKVDECNAARAAIRRQFVSQLLNTMEIYYLRQGQIQDESAIATSDFKTSFLRWDDDVRRYNTLILESDSEAQALLQKIGKRKKNMKQTEWETGRLQYCIGTLEMELRHLHTLRVTRQMQEWLSGDVSVTEERTLEGIAKHMDFVNTSMKKKVDDLNTTALRLRAQIADRTTENRAIDSQFVQLKGTVDDMQTVQTMVDAHADGSEHYTERAKDIYETSELEELARSQQEELFRLKREVDRLRERTFPSFAVVSKKTV